MNDWRQSALEATPPEQESLFESVGVTLDVVQMEYKGVRSVEWKELFAGYSSLKAITYSSGVRFVSTLLDMFEDAEVIFGCEKVLSGDLHKIMAYQYNLIERIRTQSKAIDRLLDRITAGSVRFYVAREQLSHEKIYLLAADDGRKRVIMGSANMSYSAFEGQQRENICCLDSEAAYAWYLDVFQDLKNKSTDEISYKALSTADTGDHVDALPVFETVKTRQAIVIEPAKDPGEEVQFVLDTQNLARRFAPMLSKPDSKSGKRYLLPEKIIKLKRRIQDEQVKAREQRSEYPQLVVDVQTATATLNDEKMDLAPAKEDVENDVRLFLKYMEGYEKFHGDTRGMQFRYFEFANWFFCSPFMAVMRDMAARFDQNRLPYPVFGLIYGQSKAGKTSFLETLLKMMIGQKPKIAAQEFTRSSIEALKRTVQGAPIIVDDMVNTRFNQHAIETIKTDDFGISEHLTHYSAVVISANEDVKAVSPEVTRRTVICRVEAGLTNTEVMKNNLVRSVQRNIGTAFYREYLRRMFEFLPDLIEEMKSDEVESAPDILKLSSEIIVSIIGEYADLPDYVRPLNLEDYFSEQVTGKNAIKIIRTAWRANKRAFQIDRRNDELRYNAGATYEADRLIKELSEKLEPRKSRDCVVMKLSAAEEFFGLKFRNLWFGH